MIKEITILRTVYFESECASAEWLLDEQRNKSQPPMIDVLVL